MSKKLLAVTLVLCVTGVLVMVGTANAQQVNEIKIVLNPGGRVIRAEKVDPAGQVVDKVPWGQWKKGLPTPDEVGPDAEIQYIQVHKRPGDPCVYVNGRRYCW